MQSPLAGKHKVIYYWRNVRLMLVLLTYLLFNIEFYTVYMIVIKR